MSAIKLIIFDWDGTLMDSTSQIIVCMQQAALDCQLPMPSAAAVKHIIGLGLPEAITELFPNENDEIRQAIRQAYAQHFVAGSGGQSQLYSGAHSLLTMLRSKGMLLAIATGKTRIGLDRVLYPTGLASFFDASRCADETSSKPDPLMLQELLGHFQLEAQHAVMIGDTSYDLEMASRIHMPAIGITHGAHSQELLSPFNPIALVADLPALENLFENLLLSV